MISYHNFAKPTLFWIQESYYDGNGTNRRTAEYQKMSIQYETAKASKLNSMFIPIKSKKINSTWINRGLKLWHNIKRNIPYHKYISHFANLTLIMMYGIHYLYPKPCAILHIIQSGVLYCRFKYLFGGGVTGLKNSSYIDMIWMMVNSYVEFGIMWSVPYHFVQAFGREKINKNWYEINAWTR